MAMQFGKITIISISLVMTFLLGQVFAQPLAPPQPEASSFSNMNNPGLSILDPDRIRTSHSYSFSYFSGSGGSGSVGMLMNSIEYKVSDPLKLTFDIGVMHNPSAIVGRSNSGISPVVVPGFTLQYQPSNSFLFRMSIQSYPNSHLGRYYYSGYNNGVSSDYRYR
ncbi:MAG: hypothetical protein GY855_04930 [candidate division Zixibacteria bacterium]|nr:hypothetical protein [candidate division Zixibacteria bacterium]